MSIGKRRSNLTKLTAAGVVIVAFLGGVEKFFNITERLIPDRESYQDIVTRNHNPTNVVLAEVGVQHMLGDPDSSLVVKYQNVTEMPARSFSVKANLGAEELPEFRSAIYKGFDPATLGIIPKSALEMPVASISGLEERVGGSICGVGLRPVDLGAPRPENCPSGALLRSTPLSIAAFYKTDFGEKKIMNHIVWLYHCSTCSSLNRRG
ncbi:hypothetical protein V0R51_22460 [Pseudomonas otitidis]|uniref:hypothetical protein n=1 Tax=Metapseudomonas otitidis TaxID=319939 RepID=UPI002E7BDE80|nr:hypothetical protein [Pseudomonas otitidis]MEE1895674.1 hypothetical protein [Pseudomonas otitidis]